MNIFDFALTNACREFGGRMHPDNRAKLDAIMDRRWRAAMDQLAAEPEKCPARICPICGDYAARRYDLDEADGGRTFECRRSHLTMVPAHQQELIQERQTRKRSA